MEQQSISARRLIVWQCFALAAIGGGCAGPLASTSAIVDLRKEMESSEKSSSAMAKHSRSDSPGLNETDRPLSAITPLSSSPAAATASVNVAAATDGRPGIGFPPLDSSLAGDIGSKTSSGPAHGAERDDAALAQFAAELRNFGGIDQAAKLSLLNDLKQSDPALRAQLIRQFRMMLAYRDGQNSTRATTSDANRSLLALAGAMSGAGADNESPLSLPLPPAGRRPGVREAASLIAADLAQADRQADDSEVLVSPNDETGATEREPTELPQPKKTAKPKTNSSAVVIPASYAAVVEGAPLRPPLKARGDSQSMASSKVQGMATKSLSKPAADVTSADTDDNQLQITKAILSLESAVGTSGVSPDDLRRQTQLRLLYLSAGRRDDALRPIPGLSAAQQEFWTKEFYGLATYLDSDRVADSERRATEAAMHLREAAAQIGQLASPVVRNLAFCKEVTSFGVYKKFAKYEFKAGDETLLYGEIENLKPESTDKGFRTSVKSSYQILDSHGQRVAEQEFPPSEDLCANQRRDFFIPYFIWIPKRINPGEYTLQLTVEDALSKKIGQSSIQFSVK